MTSSKQNSTLTWDDVAKFVATHLRDNHDSPEEALAVLRGIGLATASSSDGRAEIEKLDAVHQRAEAGLTSTFKPSRHDKKRVAGGDGYFYRHGRLFKKMEFAGPDRQAEALAKSLLIGIGNMFTFLNQVQLSLAPILARSSFAIRPEDRPRLEKAYEAYTGHKAGEPPEWWEGLLEGQLQMHARHVEELRLKKEHGDPDGPNTGDPELDAMWSALDAKLEAQRTGPHSALYGPVTGGELLAYLEDEAKRSTAAIQNTGIRRGWTSAEIASAESHLPPEVTVDVLEAMLNQVSLGRGGGRHSRKNSRTLVEEFAKGLRRKKRTETR